MDHIARQREVITTRYEQGFPPDVAESMLRALEESLRALARAGFSCGQRFSCRAFAIIFCPKYFGIASQRNSDTNGTAQYETGIPL
jgi:hypothetical protein